MTLPSGSSSPGSARSEVMSDKGLQDTHSSLTSVVRSQLSTSPTDMTYESLNFICGPKQQSLSSWLPELSVFGGFLSDSRTNSAQGQECQEMKPLPLEGGLCGVSQGLLWIAVAPGIP